jgi:hypothetical protein
MGLRASLKTQNYPSLLEQGRDEANKKKAVFRDALKSGFLIMGQVHCKMACLF